MKYVLAISGGVDSMVLLDMIAKNRLLLQDQVLQKEGLVVAHFDHGIRDNSSDDAELVKNLAAKYQIECAIGNGQLRRKCSEEKARQARYEFLRSLCKDGACRIVTAHHRDDLLETIVMNLIRGTGWRGLAPFWSDDILRPLLGMSKAEIINYAIKNNLEWVEDETNFSSKYFRNRVRDFVQKITPEQRKKLLRLHEVQVQLRAEIENILGKNPCRFGTCNIKSVLELPENVAIEVSRKMTGEKLTIPQLKRLLGNLKTAKSGDIFQPGGKIQVGVYRGNLTISELS